MNEWSGGHKIKKKNNQNLKEEEKKSKIRKIVVS